MGRKAAILFSNFGPYHVARIEALRDALGQQGIELVAFRFTVGSDDYGWTPEDPKDVPVVTLAQGKPAGASAALKVAITFGRELRKRKVDAVFLPTYSPLPNLLCFLAAKVFGCKTVLMTESWHGTEGASLPGKLIKHVLVRMFDSALVGGSPQTDYVVSYGMPRDRVFTGYDVVDVAHFAKRAEEFRASRTGRQSSVVSRQPESEELDALMRSLPKRYFLNLGRFVEKKNLATLVSAYARYAEGVAVAGKKLKVKGNDVEKQGVAETADGGDAAATSKTRHSAHATRHRTASLVLVGEGPLRGDLERRARDLGLPVRDGVVDPNPSGGVEVVFYPFQQADVTPLFFARCEAFVLPSTREEWGLVVNEAMACGAPVIVSNRVGSHFDLVRDGGNGFIFAPADAEQLARILSRFEEDPALSRRLGDEGSKMIQSWTPVLFGSAGRKAYEAALAA